MPLSTRAAWAAWGTPWTPHQQVAGITDSTGALQVTKSPCAPACTGSACCMETNRTVQGTLDTASPSQATSSTPVPASAHLCHKAKHQAGKYEAAQYLAQQVGGLQAGVRELHQPGGPLHKSRLGIRQRQAGWSCHHQAAGKLTRHCIGHGHAEELCGVLEYALEILHLSTNIRSHNTSTT